ncbi:MAG: ABC transporter ATP-binding protein [Chloroflexi bacterium]|nr:ABC transporter ATP-binding protein [Chloroflexota bacterium]
MQILESERVTKNFGGLAAVSRVDFNVDQGQVVGLIGPNGAGKTTLFNLISGALVPDSGEIRFKGKKISGVKPHQICHGGVARTFQAVHIFGTLSARDNVLLGALFGKSRSVSSADAAQEAMELLDFTGLSAMSATLAKDLTLANQKRLEVARALATQPELLLLDELMAGLNPTEVAQAMEMVTQIRDKGITILMIEHVMKAIMNVCDRIIVLHHGEKIAEGTPQEIATSKTVVEVYLGESAYAAG